MTYLTVCFDLEGWTKEQLQQAVADIDELDSGPGKGIAPENVTAWDVLQYIATGQIGIVEDLKDTEGNLIVAGQMRVITNKIGDLS
jgi:hypothetical protein